MLTIDADENITATEVARSITVLDAVNLMSAAWNDVSADTIQNCFFRGLTPRYLMIPFLDSLLLFLINFPSVLCTII